MPNTFSYLKPSLENISISPKMVQLFIPPIKWHGDPKGHMGVYDTFFYVASGECSLMIDDEWMILNAGDLAFLPRNRVRAYSNMSQTITLYEMNFVAEINGRNWFEELGLDFGIYSIRVDEPDAIKELLESSVRYEFNRSMLYDVVHASNLLTLIKIFSFELEKQNSATTQFKAVTDYMKANLDKQIKISELAELMFMEETYFIKKFKRAFSDSPISYLNKLKIYKSMQYLAKSNMTLSEISHKVGVYDSSYFAKLFKTNCTLTPSEYRELFQE